MTGSPTHLALLLSSLAQGDSSAPASPALWLDLVGLALVLGSALLGLRGGLWWQLVRLLGVVACVAVARAVAPALGASLEALFAGLDPRLAIGLAWVLVLLCGSIVVALVARVGVRAGAAFAELSWVDRAGGALAGAVAGVVMHAALLLCVGHLAAPDWAAARVRGSHSQQLVSALGRGIPGLLDARAAETLGVRAER
jgi:uncharacterized membrane protein required for colicin V production